jgi:hypothetical protein
MISNSFDLCTAAFSIISLLVLIFAIGNQQQYANGITNSTSTMCINDKCVTTTCINNEPCRTFTSNSTVIGDNNSTKDKGTIILPPIPQETI